MIFRHPVCPPRKRCFEFARIVLWGVMVIFAATSPPIEAFTIRCADPKCPLCLAIPGAESPKTADSREPRRHPEDEPFGRDASLAVVNPVMKNRDRAVMSLGGDWEFQLDPNGLGVTDRWMEPETAWEKTGSMPVPGNWEANGVGDPGMSRPWNCSWDCIPRSLRNIYIGSAWYRRTVSIPAEWSGEQIWLKIGGVRAQAWFWIDGEPVAHLAPYCGAFRYDITDLAAPGKEITIVALVRNDVPSRSGVVSACHVWGGFSRDIELEATPATHLGNVECFGQFDTQSVQVRVEVVHPANVPGTADLEISVHRWRPGDSIEAEPVVGSLHKRIDLSPDKRSDFIEEIPLADFAPWSPESPNLYVAEVTLRCDDGSERPGDGTIHGWTERFGVKKFESRGNRFFLNDKPFFVRGYGDDAIYPETLVSLPDRDVHRQNLDRVRQSGFVYVRHHTHCELPEFYDAADELGIMIQAELPYYPYNGYHTTESFDFDPKRDLAEVIDHYRRYVSMSAFSMGNEGHLGTPLDVELKEMVHTQAPLCLAMHNDGGFNTPENSDFDTPNIACVPVHPGTSIVPWAPGTFAGLTIPFISHEYMNLGLKLDPRLSPRFTGAILPLRPLDRYEAKLHAIGLDRYWGDRCLDAGHALQKHYQKIGIESARRDPDCDGYSFWTIVDVMVKYGEGDDYTGQGIFNPFYEPKPHGMTPEALRPINAPTVILLESEPTSRILVEGETLEQNLWISHFGGESFVSTLLTWSIKTDSEELATGKFPISAKPGDVIPLGKVTWTVTPLEKPMPLTLEVSLDGTEVTNRWEFWAFPEFPRRMLHHVAVTDDLFEPLSIRYDGLIPIDSPGADTATVVVGSANHPETQRAIDAGKSVLVVGPADGAPNVALGWWWIGDQTGTAFANHPAFGDFPHNKEINPLWFRILKRGEPLQPSMPFVISEWLAVGEGRDAYFLYAAETKNENVSPHDTHAGKVLRTFGLDLLADLPESAWLCDQMLRYLESASD